MSIQDLLIENELKINKDVNLKDFIKTYYQNNLTIFPVINNNEYIGTK